MNEIKILKAQCQNDFLEIIPSEEEAHTIKEIYTDGVIRAVYSRENISKVYIFLRS